MTMQATGHILKVYLFSSIFWITFGECLRNLKEALHACVYIYIYTCVYIYIQQLSSFRVPRLWFIDLTVTSCHIQYPTDEPNWQQQKVELFGGWGYTYISIVLVPSINIVILEFHIPQEITQDVWCRSSRCSA